MSKILMKRLRKSVRGCKLKLVKKDANIQTISVDGEEIELAWEPHIDSFSDETILDILAEDCLAAINTKRKKPREKKSEKLT
tara:strand:- start:412 stop:657 length:246 start_codon:yes stop_codon:yes gene_type:complete